MIAVVDSGLDRSHPEFAGKIVPGGRDFVGDVDGGCPGPEDEYGHGTYVAGIAAALTSSARGTTARESPARRRPVPTSAW